MLDCEILDSGSGVGDISGVSGLEMNSVTLTSSPTRSTAPLGPAQAYWPNTGLSAEKLFSGDLRMSQVLTYAGTFH